MLTVSDEFIDCAATFPFVSNVAIVLSDDEPTYPKSLFVCRSFKFSEKTFKLFFSVENAEISASNFSFFCSISSAIPAVSAFTSDSISAVVLIPEPTPRCERISGLESTYVITYKRLFYLKF